MVDWDETTRWEVRIHAANAATDMMRWPVGMPKFERMVRAWIGGLADIEALYATASSREGATLLLAADRFDVMAARGFWGTDADLTRSLTHEMRTVIRDARDRNSPLYRAPLDGLDADREEATS